MTARALAITAASAIALALGACGGGGDTNPAAPAAAGAPPDPNDKRGIALQCIKEKQLAARLVGKQSIQVGAFGGPRVEFFVSGGEAEGQQFQGQGQAAEQIGSALLFINEGNEDQLDKIEACLDDQ
ncbi:MAG: hypothetical protein ACR2HC_00410 [Thermoleophilaceae bacterium]